jgi:hypothetical protein
MARLTGQKPKGDFNTIGNTNDISENKYGKTNADINTLDKKNGYKCVPDKSVDVSIGGLKDTPKVGAKKN